MPLLLFFTPKPLAKSYIHGYSRKLKSGKIVVVNPHYDKRAKKQTDDITFSVHDGHDEDLAFVHEALTELAEVDELFRFPVSRQATLPGVMRDIAPDFNFIGDDTRLDEAKESGADQRLLFKTDKGKPFYVYQKDDELWIDVSRLSTGEGGAAIYMALGNYAYNTRRIFIGDPEGLSDDAVIRRTANMLSLALRFGTTGFMEPSPEQKRGIPKIGVAPLKWQGNDVDKTKALIYTFLTTLRNQFPEIKEIKYDFDSKQFVRTRDGQPVGWAKFDKYRKEHGTGSGARAGAATARRGAFIQSLISSPRGQRPGILGLVLSRANQLVKQGNLPGLFARQKNVYPLGHKYPPGHKTGGLSVNQVIAALPKNAKALRDSGVLRVIPTIYHAPHGDVIAAAHSGLRIQGYYNRTDDRIFLVADALNTKTLPGTLHHELYHRAEAIDGQLRGQLNALDKRLSARFDLAAQGQASAIENAAYRRVMRANTPNTLQLKEFKAYLVTEHHHQPQAFTGAILQWLKDLYATIRGALIRQGVLPGEITASDLNALAAYGAKPRRDMPLAKAFAMTLADGGMPHAA